MFQLNQEGRDRVHKHHHIDPGITWGKKSLFSWLKLREQNYTEAWLDWPNEVGPFYSGLSNPIEQFRSPQVRTPYSYGQLAVS